MPHYGVVISNNYNNANIEYQPIAIVHIGHPMRRWPPGDLIHVCVCSCFAKILRRNVASICRSHVRWHQPPKQNRQAHGYRFVCSVLWCCYFPPVESKRNTALMKIIQNNLSWLVVCVRHARNSLKLILLIMHICFWDNQNTQRNSGCTYVRRTERQRCARYWYWSPMHNAQ